LGLSGSNLEFKFCHSSLELEELHIEGSLLSLEGGDLLLYSRVLCLLMGVMSLHLLLDLEILIGKSFSNILGLHCEN